MISDSDLLFWAILYGKTNIVYNTAVKTETTISIQKN